MSPRTATVALFALFAASLTAPVAADWQAGVAAFKAGDYATAEAEFQAVAEAQPDWPGGHRMLGQTLLLAGRAKDAVAPLERAVELAPDDLVTALNLSQTYLRIDRAADAAAVLAKRDPSSLPAAQQASFYRTRGVARHRSAPGSAAAVEDLSTAARLAPGDAETHHLLCQTARAAGQADAAVAACERAVELAPADARIQETWVAVLLDQQLCDRAVGPAKALATKDPSYENLLSWGESALCAGRHEEALDPLTRAAALRSSWLTSFYLGQAKSLLERWDEAESSLDAALAADVPESQLPRVWSQLGYVHERTARYDEAIADYTKAGFEEGVARARKSQEIEKENQRQADIQAAIDKAEKDLHDLDAKADQLH